MKTEISTAELVEMTGINPRTFTNWSRLGWLPPSRPGGGRSRPNLFDLVSAAWAKTLHDILEDRPHAATPCYLDYRQFGDQGYEPIWVKTTIADGAAILKFLRTAFPHKQLGRCVLLAKGVIDRTISRFAEVRIAEYDRLRPYVEGWVTTQEIVTRLEPTPQDDAVKVIRSVTLYNYEQNLRSIKHAANRL